MNRRRLVARRRRRAKPSTTRFVQPCPVCSGPGERLPSMIHHDCTCLHCGWFYTSTLKRSVLRALCRAGSRGPLGLSVGYVMGAGGKAVRP